METLDIVIQNGELDTVKQLIDQNNIDYALASASMYGQTHIAEYLLENGAQISYNGYDCVWYCAKFGHLELLKLLVKYGGPQICIHKCEDDIYKDTNLPLYHAISYGNLNVFEYIFALYDFTKINSEYILYISLRLAAYSGMLSIVERVLNMGACMSMNDGYMNPLESAIYKGHAHIVKYLILHGATFTNTKHIMEKAVNSQKLEVVQCLIEPHKYIPDCPKHIQGVDVHSNDDIGIQRAAACGNIPMIAYLISQGANIHTMNDAPNKWALFNEHTEAAEYIRSLY